MTSDIQNGLYFKVISQKSTIFYSNCKKRLENTNALYVLFALPWITRPLYPFDIGGTWQIKILSYLVGAYNLKKEKTRLVICYVYNVYMY